MPGPHADFGRALGVTWPYLVWALGYESVWSILVPIQLTELMFPPRRDDPWLRTRSRAVVAGVFCVGCVVAWHTWTHVVRPQVLHEPMYVPPPATMAAAAVLAGVLVCVALLVPWARDRASVHQGSAPAPWAVGVSAALLGCLWFCSTVSLPSLGSWALRLPPAAPIAFAVVVAAAALLAFGRWAGARGWSDRHRLAATTGALVASMGMGFVANDVSNLVNLVGKIVLDLAALVLLAVLAWRSARFRPATAA